MISDIGSSIRMRIDKETSSLDDPSVFEESFWNYIEAISMAAWPEMIFWFFDHAISVRPTLIVVTHGEYILPL